MHRLSLLGLCGFCVFGSAACATGSAPTPPTQTVTQTAAPRLPVSSSALTATGQAVAQVSAQAIRFEHARVELDARRSVPPEALVGGRDGLLIRDLLPVLEEAAAVLPEGAPCADATRPAAERGALVLEADRNTPYATMTRIMHTAAQAGFGAVEFRVRPIPGGEPGSVVRAAIPAFGAASDAAETDDESSPCATPASSPPLRDDRLVFHIVPDGIVVVHNGDVLPPRRGCPHDATATVCNIRPDAAADDDRYDWDGLSRLALARLSEWPADQPVVIAADADTPLKTVLRLTDVLRFKPAPESTPFMPEVVLGVS